MSEIDSLLAEITSRLQAKNAARDRALADSRQTVRHAANAIRALHRGESGLAEVHLQQGRAMAETARQDLASYPEVYWAGYVQDAQKEVSEAHLVAAIIGNRPLPRPGDLGVEDAPYLNGMAEAASEMRRYVLDIIRRSGPEDMDEAERILATMDDIYTGLIAVDFPDQVTGGLRRSCDALRAVLERTRGDLTISMRQAELSRALSRRAQSPDL